MQNRRRFIRNLSGAAAMLATQPLWGQGLLASTDDVVEITILHTNDVHSRLEPFPANDAKYPGMGGAARRAALINQIRQTTPHVLLLDAGDMFQGTPYYNLFYGEPELKTMSLMGYNAATLGNHDFDNGTEGFAKVMHHANFDILNANYTLTDTPLHNKTKPYKVFNVGGIKVGVFGIGIDLNGLVPAKLVEGVVYNNPVEVANKYSAILKNDLKCAIVVCLSHLGFEYKDNKMSDKVLAAQTQNINAIIGGHTHTFLDIPVTATNSMGKPVLITQVGWAGLRLGCLKFSVQHSTNQMVSYAHTTKKL